MEDDFDEIPIAILFQTGDRDTLAALEEVFEDDEILQSHAFGGADVVTVLTTLSRSTIGRLLAFLARKGMATPKTTFEIGSKKIVLKGYSPADVEALLASPHFKSAVKAVGKK